MMAGCSEKEQYPCVSCIFVWGHRLNSAVDHGAPVSLRGYWLDCMWEPGEVLDMITVLLRCNLVTPIQRQLVNTRIDFVTLLWYWAFGSCLALHTPWPLDLLSWSSTGVLCCIFTYTCTAMHIQCKCCTYMHLRKLIATSYLWACFRVCAITNIIIVLVYRQNYHQTWEKKEAEINIRVENNTCCSGARSALLPPPPHTHWLDRTIRNYAPPCSLLFQSSFLGRFCLEALASSFWV